MKSCETHEPLCETFYYQTSMPSVVTHPDDEAGDDPDDGGEGEGVGPQAAHARPRPLHLVLVTAIDK